MSDQFDLSRFRSAQDSGAVYEHAVDELRAGRKATHWMWFVFPQLAGLGQSATSQLYSIDSLGEARAYLRDPVLGKRLVECAGVLAARRARSAVEIFGSVDAMKLRSSMTLFARASSEEPIFGEVLVTYFDGIPDPATERLLDQRQV
jgi:uncharacterized protein (DUF1810 family)